MKWINEKDEIYVYDVSKYSLNTDKLVTMNYINPDNPPSLAAVASDSNSEETSSYNTNDQRNLLTSEIPSAKSKTPAPFFDELHFADYE